MCIDHIKVSALAVLSTLLTISDASATSYAPWLTQIGISDTILSAANWGKGQILGVVDTGIIAGNQVFAPGQVSVALSSCAALTAGICSKGVTDDNGHGTAVASIAAANTAMPFTATSGGYTTRAASVMGVAPNANIVADKVLNANGSGYSSDVSNGIIKAVNAGANVINLSMTFIPDSGTIAALNYAAGKGVFVVYAGGNSATAFLSGANTSGLTGAAIQHLVFAGSVNSKNLLSTFSNTPGKGSLQNSGSSTAYSARWIMAPGENIIAPGIVYGATAYASWSGTSMAAPIVSGSLILLQNAWPILKTNGTTANLLLATATDLGVKGIDGTYGNGLVNLATAFSPYGTLMVAGADGTPIALSSINGTLISGGALGSLSTVSSKLASYTTLDAYSRNFTVNLSGMIKVPASAAVLSTLPTNVRSAPNKMSMANGTELSYVIPVVADRFSMLGVFGANPEAMTANRTAYAMLTDAKGNAMAMGYGNMLPAQYTYTRAMYGSENAAMAASDLATHLSTLSQGGLVTAYGAQIAQGTRLAVSYSQTDNHNDNLLSTPWLMPDASNVGLGITQVVSKQLQVGFSIQTLDEKHGLLGSAYDPASSMSLGNSNHSEEMGISALITLDPEHSFFMEASQANTKAATATGVFAGTTGIRAQALGMSYTEKNLLSENDQLTFSVKQPMRVTSGSVNMAVINIDAVTGVASSGITGVSLAPGGKETDYKVSYAAPLTKNQSINFVASYMKDALNMSGNNYANVAANWVVRF